MTLDMSEALKSARQALTEKRPDDAIGLLRQIRQTAPKSAEALSLLGAAYAEKRDYFQALHFFERSLAIQPTARGWFNVAALHKMQGDTVQARTALDRALGLDPEYERARQMLSQLGPPPPQPAIPAPFPAPDPVGARQPSDPIGPQYPQMGDPLAQPSSVAGQARPQLQEEIIWWKVIVGGLMVGLPSLLIWGGLTSLLSLFLPAVLSALIGTVAVVGVNLWLATNVGDLNIELWHWILLGFALVVALYVVMKGYEMISSGWYASRSV